MVYLLIEKWILFFFDETHFGGTTDISKEIMNTFSKEDTIKIFMTGTFMKPLHLWNIPSNCCFHWGLDDEQLCKKKNIIELRRRYGDFDETELEYYKNCPDLHYISLMFDENGDRFRTLLDWVRNTLYEFSFGALFQIDKNGRFVHEIEVKIFLRYVSGSNYEDFPLGDKSIFGRMNSIRLKYDLRICSYTTLVFTNL